MQQRQQRTKAFADATAGVVGSLAAMLAFYPVDVWKTSLQANNAASASADNNTGVLLSPRGTSKFNVTSTSPLIPARTITSKTFTRLFRGLPFKIAHTIASSFTYWFVYSLLQTKYAAYQLNIHFQHHSVQKSQTTFELSPSISSKNSSSSSSSSNSSSVVAKLVLTAIAAMINTGITLPLDTISSRRQVALVLINDGDDEGKISNTQRRQSQQAQPNQQRQQDQYKQQLKSILSLWNGLLPALMLCTNPAIQHTLYDMFKAAWLVRRRYYNRLQAGPSPLSSSSSSSSLSNNTKRRQHSLSMPEAFACGMISKFIATMITYPLIRCKVMLMVSPSAHSTTTTITTTTPTCSTGTSILSTGGKEECTILENGHEAEERWKRKKICNGSHNVQRGERHEGARMNSSSSSSTSTSMKKHPYPHSLPLLLLHIYKYDGGIRGIYRGCSLQLLHTVLKSALLMMVRERIVYASHRFFRIEE